MKNAPSPFSHTRTFCLISFLVASGCSGKDIVDPPAPDPLAVTATVPAAGSTAADPFAIASVTFNAALDASTVTPAAITVAAGATTLASTLALDGAARTVELAAPLLPGTQYQANVAATIRSSAGTQLAQPYPWTFQTRDWQNDPVGAKRDYRPFTFVRDGSGMLHRLAPVTDGSSMALVYAFCSASCQSASSWREVQLFSSGNIAGHAILIDGSSRHIFFQNASTGALHYGTCSSSCDSVGSWQIAAIALSSTHEDGHDRVSVARESGGRLLIATVSWTGSGYGVTFGTCAADCANPASWQHVLVAPDGRAPALVLDSSGALHMLFRRPGDSQLVYARCTDSCLTPSSWQLTALGPAGTFASPELLWTTGGLHAAFNVGFQITYYFCASNCGSASAWTSTVIDDVTGNDQTLALLRAADGRLHLFYPDIFRSRLKYATCVTECTTAPGWQTGVAATGLGARVVRAALESSGAPFAITDDAPANRLLLVH